jgi:Fe-S-cluster containining protein
VDRAGHEVWDHPEVAAVFRCQRCGACCQGGEAGIELRPEEADSIARHLGHSPKNFLARFCLNRGGRLLLRRRSGGMCSLWNEGCLAWEVKPRTCSLWPFPARLLADDGGMEAVRASCPGIKPEATPGAWRRALHLVHRFFPPAK